MRDRETIDSTRLRGGMQVFGAAGQPLGAIERFDDAELVVQGQRYPLALIDRIDRIEGDRVYLGAQAAPPGAGAPVAAPAAPAPGATRAAAGGTTAPATGAAPEQVIDRRGQRDVYVPFAAVAEASAGRLRLTVPADAVDDQGWPNPPLL